MTDPTIHQMARKLCGLLHDVGPYCDCENCEHDRPIIEQVLREVAARENERCAQIVPTSWLDGLLTGPDAVVGSPPYGCQDIERLLRAIKAAIRFAAGREE